jgi:hypothetical protein
MFLPLLLRHLRPLLVHTLMSFLLSPYIVLNSMGSRVTWLQVAVTFNVCTKMSFLFRDRCFFCSHILSICCKGHWGQCLCNPWCLVASAQLFHMQNCTTWNIWWNQLLSVIFDKNIRRKLTTLSSKPFKMWPLRRISRWIR